MSGDTIKRADAIKSLDNAWINGTGLLDANEAIKQLNDLPSADRPQGEWTQNVFRSDIYRYECSNCKAHHRARYDYCPSCGARMKGADDENNH